MNKVYNLDGNLIKADLRLGSVHIVANYALRNAVKEKIKNVEYLCHLIKENYYRIYGAPLKIKMDSLIMEILGHIIAYRILLFFRKIYPLGLFRKLSLHVCNIDCGEKYIDRNRWFWDMCGYFRPVIFKIIR